MRLAPPVRLHVEPMRMDRLHVAIRLVLLVALGAVGTSSVYWIAYLAIPAVVALVVSQRGAEDWITRVAPRIVPVLRWLAGAYAYLWLLTDALPTTEDRGPVKLAIEPAGMPTPSSALTRLITSLPALLLVAVMSIVGVLFWIVGAIAILAVGRVPPWVADFLAMMLRVQFRLIAYHASLVETYPSLDEWRADETHARAV